MNRIKFIPVVGEDEVAPSIVRRVVVPFGVRRPGDDRGWKVRGDADTLFGEKAVTKKRGEGRPQVLRQGQGGYAILVTKAPQSGKVHVFLGKRQLTEKPIRLSAKQVKEHVLIPVKTFGKVQKGNVRVVVVSKGSLVRVEGIGIAKR